MQNNRDVFKGITIFVRKRRHKVQKQLEHAVKQDTRKDASLKQSNVKHKEWGPPFFGANLSADFIIIIQNKLAAHDHDSANWIKL
jgi:hypothetical protein